jgi:hypothetical protein
MPWPDSPPSYNLRYGFKDGAQLDLFDTKSAADNFDDPELPTAEEADVAGVEDRGYTDTATSAQRPLEAPHIHVEPDWRGQVGEGSYGAGISGDDWDVLVSPDGAQVHLSSPYVRSDSHAMAEKYQSEL